MYTIFLGSKKISTVPTFNVAELEAKRIVNNTDANPTVDSYTLVAVIWDDETAAVVAIVTDDANGLKIRHF